MRQPTVFSVFTGAGGLDLGLECAGFRVAACVESDQAARETIRKNRSKWRFLKPSDVNDLAASISPNDLGIKPGKLGVLAGGPPCQPFSKAAQWADNGTRGFADPRSRCLESFLVLVDKFLPEVVLIENVPGFASGQNSAIPRIEAALSAINAKHSTNYLLQYRLLDAVEYGVPQRRTRAILIAIRSGSRFMWPEPSHAGKPVRAYDALSGVHASSIPLATGRWARLLPSIPEGYNYLWHTPEGGGLPLFGYRTRYWSFLLKLAKSQPAWTLPASPGPSTGPFHWKNRPLAIEELLRLQTFPASWKVEGDYRTQVRQIGNATPPLLAEVIGREIGRQVFGLSYDNELPHLRITPKRRVPPPEKVMPVPEEYRELEGAHSPHPGSGKGPKPRSKEQDQMPLFEDEPDALVEASGEAEDLELVFAAHH